MVVNLPEGMTILYKDIITIVTDNVEKNVVAIENLKTTFNKNIIHMRCGNHVINLFLDIIINNDFFYQFTS